MNLDKGKLVGHVSATLGGLILAGIVGSFLGEKLGYSAGVLYLYALLGHTRVKELIERKVNK